MTLARRVDWWVSVNIVTGSIALSARRRYLSDSQTDFEVFRPAGATRCTDARGEVKLSIDCKKAATGNGNLKPEIEIDEHSNSKILLESFTT